MPESMERQFKAGMKGQAGAAAIGGLVRVASGPVTPLTVEQRQALVRAEQLASRLDGLFIDPLLGLFLPGLGDVGGVLLGLIPVGIAWRGGAPPRLLLAMLINLTVDLLVGYVPVVGDLLDFLVRANQRNAVLLREWQGSLEAEGSKGLGEVTPAAYTPTVLAPRWVGAALVSLMLLLVLLSGLAFYGFWSLLQLL